MEPVPDVTRTGSDQTGPDWIKSDRTGLDRTGLQTSRKRRRVTSTSVAIRNWTTQFIKQLKTNVNIWNFYC